MEDHEGENRSRGRTGIGITGHITHECRQEGSEYKTPRESQEEGKRKQKYIYLENATMKPNTTSMN